MAAWLGRTPWALLWLFLAASVSAAPPLADRLGCWTSQLDADDFLTREAAAQKLIAAGPSAIGALASSIHRKNPEVAWRATAALQQIALDGDDATFQQVVATLQQGRNCGASVLPGIATQLSAKRARSRHDRAVAQIRSLGGKFNCDVATTEDAVNIAVVPLPRLIVSDEEKLPVELAEPAGIGALDAALRAIDGLVAVPVPAPPPDLPPDAVLPAMAPVAGNGETLIGDAFVSPELEEATERQKPADSLTLDHSWQGSDAGIACLHDLPSIVSLSLCRAPLTDAALPHIAALPRLQTLAIEGSPFSAPALRSFREQQPQVQVLVRN